MKPDWKQLKQDVNKKIDVLEIIHNGLKCNVSKKLIERGLIISAVAHLGAFCAWVDMSEGNHFCSGNNMTEDRAEELKEDEEDITRTERDNNEE